jgi:hypothetical protein
LRKNKPKSKTGDDDSTVFTVLEILQPELAAAEEEEEEEEEVLLELQRDSGIFCSARNCRRSGFGVGAHTQTDRQRHIERGGGGDHGFEEWVWE